MSMGKLFTQVCLLLSGTVFWYWYLIMWLVCSCSRSGGPSSYLFRPP